MSDITKCSGKDCYLRMTCYRYTATEGMWQSWSDFDSDTKPCKHYWEIKEIKRAHVNEGANTSTD